MKFRALEAARIGVICGVSACPEAEQAQVPGSVAHLGMITTL
jgi:hypothetical protein